MFDLKVALVNIYGLTSVPLKVTDLFHATNRLQKVSCLDGEVKFEYNSENNSLTTKGFEIPVDDCKRQSLKRAMFKVDF